VISGDVIDGNGRIDLARDPAVLGDLRGVAWLVHQIARDDDKGGAQPVDGGDGELEVRGVLREILVFSEHPELGVAELDEEERLGRGDAGGGADEQREECEENECFHEKIK